MAVLDFSMASSRGRMPEMAKKQVCMMVLVRRPMPVSGHVGRVDAVDLEPEVDDLLLHLDREVVPDLIGAEGRVDEEGGTRLCVGEHVELLDEDPLVAGHEVGLADQDRTSGSDRARSGGGRW